MPSHLLLRSQLMGKLSAPCVTSGHLLSWLCCPTCTATCLSCSALLGTFHFSFSLSVPRNSSAEPWVGAEQSWRGPRKRPWPLLKGSFLSHAGRLRRRHQVQEAAGAWWWPPAQPQGFLGSQAPLLQHHLQPKGLIRQIARLS